MKVPRAPEKSHATREGVTTEPGAFFCLQHESKGSSMKKIIVRLEGNATDGNVPLVGNQMHVLGRIYDTELGEFVSEWAKLPASAVTIEASAVDYARATMTVPVGQLENIEAALDVATITEIALDRTREVLVSDQPEVWTVPGPPLDVVAVRTARGDLWRRVMQGGIARHDDLWTPADRDTWSHSWALVLAENGPLTTVPADDER